MFSLKIKNPLHQKLVIFVTIGIIATGFSYLLFDKAIARFIDYWSWGIPFKIFFETYTMAKGPLLYTLIILCIANMIKSKGQILHKINRALIEGGFSVIIAYATTKFLKLAFGRFWPGTWINNNPSLLLSNDYGFNFFHGGADFASFPSGHMAVVSALATILCLTHKSKHETWKIFTTIMAISLLVLDYHFLSDIIAGTVIGITIALLVHDYLKKIS